MNLLARIPGNQRPDDFLLLSAHYDHLGWFGSGDADEIFSGADDNASGVAGLLSKYFTLHPPVPLESIRANLNVDMIARSADGALWLAGTRHSPELRATLESVVTELPCTVRFGHDRLGWPFLEHDWTEAGDHFAFHEAGIPWAYIGTKNDPETHDVHDSMKSIDEEFSANAVDSIAQLVEAVDREPPAR